MNADDFMKDIDSAWNKATRTTGRGSWRQKGGIVTDLEGRIVAVCRGEAVAALIAMVPDLVDPDLRGPLFEGAPDLRGRVSLEDAYGAGVAEGYQAGYDEAVEDVGDGE